MEDDIPKLHKAKKSKHRMFNNILSLVVLIYAGYILLLPIYPNIALWIKNQTDENNGLPYESILVEDNSNNEPEEKPKKRKPIPEENRLVLPTVKLNEEIIEGTAAQTVHLGVWRKPFSSSPDKGGNTVLVGHRFTYSDPAVFFHLDKIKEGDKFPLYWEKQEYNYQVTEIKVVNPDQLSIEAPTDDARLTIYTCTPVWTSNQRLVIVAKLIDTSNEDAKEFINENI